MGKSQTARNGWLSTSDGKRVLSLTTLGKAGLAEEWEMIKADSLFGLIP